ncbi:hypothetical protein E3U36_05815 [Arsenophonus endosymbiont of Aphis craccivora]|uniref:hypothetical protein n=2 Tax=unclassified Arsenophonus TaxID=2627083 RepID=UPI0015DD376D|nr:hypothetical protein [Arsenophonus endosymbiont of Aphis craccivora]QLK87766.1 hypothetical protein E3U36_05815 [Arsenophonus endosymbiont of Aphis craccivora]
MNSYQEINTFINHVYGENRFSNDEFQTIFHYANHKFDTLLTQFDKNQELADFQQSINHAVQLMQNSLEKVGQNGDIECEQKNKIKVVFISQMLYLFANFDRAFSSL